MPYCYRWSAWRRWLPVWLRRTALARPVVLFVQRGRRGWSDEDLWQFDHHIGRVIAGGLRRMAVVTYGYPGEHYGFNSLEEWRAFLVAIADDLDAWVSTPDAFLDRDAYDRAQNAMRRLAEHYGSYWD